MHSKPCLYYIYKLSDWSLCSKGGSQPIRVSRLILSRNWNVGETLMPELMFSRARILTMTHQLGHLLRFATKVWLRWNVDSMLTQRSLTSLGSASIRIFQALNLCSLSTHSDWGINLHTKSKFQPCWHAIQSALAMGRTPSRQKGNILTHFLMRSVRFLELQCGAIIWLVYGTGMGLQFWRLIHTTRRQSSSSRLDKHVILWFCNSIYVSTKHESTTISTKFGTRHSFSST